MKQNARGKIRDVRGLSRRMAAFDLCMTRWRMQAMKILAPGIFRCAGTVMQMARFPIRRHNPWQSRGLCVPWHRPCRTARQGFMLVLMAITLPLISGCGVILHHYPEPNVGWHSKNYSVVLGVLSLHETNPVSWTVRYSSVYAGDTYGGKFALTPTSSLVGFQPGNTVEIFGHPESKVPNKAGTGTLYHVQSIRLWLGKGRPSYMTR
jgi:hypothetical protein